MLPRRTALATGGGATADHLVPRAPARARPELDGGFGPRAAVAFFGVLALVLFFVAYSIYHDINDSGTRSTTVLPFVLLGVALFVALGFEFVNGFHDTANAVATVIYTHSMPPYLAVFWSGMFNFLGVLASSGAVAYGIIALLPAELILKVGSQTGFAMVFALLIGAIVWNLGTWYLGLPASSSHTLVGSIIGVGLMNQLMASGAAGASGVDWGQTTKVGYSLMLSPFIGFTASALLLIVLKLVARNPELYAEPRTDAPPPWWMRGILILTCTSVSFAHGSNDGQKGMGLIMLILIGVVPTAYALNRAMPDSVIQPFLATSARAAIVLDHYGEPAPVVDPRAAIGTYLASKTLTPAIVPSVATLVRDIQGQVARYGSLRRLPANTVQNVRNDMYLVDETLRRLGREPKFTFAAADAEVLHAYRAMLESATRFIPLWVKIAVAVALGLGTMVGWKRIVITVGEKIGKSHLTYAQGASAELVAATTIAAADLYGLPVSTTHVLSSGVAGTMAANRSGLQITTLRNLLMAWVLTMPAAIVLSGGLFWLFIKIF